MKTLSWMVVPRFASLRLVGAATWYAPASSQFGPFGLGPNAKGREAGCGLPWLVVMGKSCPVEIELIASGPADTSLDFCPHRVREVLRDARLGVFCVQPVRASEVPIIV